MNHTQYKELGLSASLEDEFGAADLQQVEVEQPFLLTPLSCPVGAACKQQHPALRAGPGRLARFLPVLQRRCERLMETRTGLLERFSPVAVNLQR